MEIDMSKFKIDLTAGDMIDSILKGLKVALDDLSKNHDVFPTSFKLHPGWLYDPLSREGHILITLTALPPRKKDPHEMD